MHLPSIPRRSCPPGTYPACGTPSSLENDPSVNAEHSFPPPPAVRARDFWLRRAGFYCGRAGSMCLAAEMNPEHNDACAGGILKSHPTLARWPNRYGGMIRQMSTLRDVANDVPKDAVPSFQPEIRIRVVKKLSAARKIHLCTK